MLKRIFPRQFDNGYRGHWLAIWILALAMGLKAVQGVNSIVMTHDVAIKADGLPVDSYGTAGSEAVLGLFALLGLSILILPVLSFVALLRYRAMIPLLYLMLLLQTLAARAVLLLHPIARITDSSASFGGQPPGFWINLAILAVTIIGFGLSLADRSRRDSQNLAQGVKP